MGAMTHDPADETLCFGYGESRLGLVLVALSGRGVAAILLGDKPLALLPHGATNAGGLRGDGDDQKGPGLEGRRA